MKQIKGKQAHLILSLSASIIFQVTLAYAVPDVGYVENYIEDYLGDGSLSTFSETRPEVEANIEDWANNPSRRPYQGGNVFDPEDLIEYEEPWVQFETWVCNGGDEFTPWGLLHSYDQLHQGHNEEGIHCGVKFNYETKPESWGFGYPMGLCRVCFFTIPLDPCFPCRWIETDLVEYYFPTQKINVSDQIFTSRHLNVLEAYQVEGELKQHLIRDAWVNKVPGSVKMIGNNPHLGTSIGDDVDTVQVPIISGDYGLPWWTWARRQAGEVSFSRHFGEDGIASDYKPAIIHEVKTSVPHTITDYEYLTAYWGLHTASLNSSVWNDFWGEPQTCIRNNMALGRTDPGLMGSKSGWTAKVENKSPYRDWETFESTRCLDNIGEINPYQMHNRRMHITDGVFQQMIKGIQMHRSLHPTHTTYTYSPSLDKFHFLPDLTGPGLINEKIKEDLNASNVQCNPIKDWAAKPHLFRTANTREVNQTVEATADVFTRFRGCWGINGSRNRIFQGFFGAGYGWVIPFPFLDSAFSGDDLRWD